MTDRICEPDTSCAARVAAPRSGLLIDGEDYYRAVYDACVRARRSILMLGWQFDSRVALLHGDEARAARYPVTLRKFLTKLCEERPDLQIFMLAWRSSPLFAFEREPLQSLSFKLRSHCNLRFELDDCHPLTGSHHQKLVIVDRSIAMLGGMDLCTSRWDDRAHHAVDHRRDKPFPLRGHYHPYHDVQSYVTGPAVDLLRDWFCRRWKLGTGEDLTLHDAPAEDLPIRASVEVNVPEVSLARTLPELEDHGCAEVRELEAMHLAAIAAAERYVYIENQYFTSEKIRKALIERMRRDDDAIEIVIVLPDKSAGMKEQVGIGVRQAEILRELKAVAVQTGHHVGVYYPAAPGPKGDESVFIHAKVLAVDDRFLLVSSANTTNRSLGLDTELGMAWETEAPDDSLAEARLELMREHVGLSIEEARDQLRDPAGMVARLDAMARARSHRLRMHAMCEDAQPGLAIAHALREDVPLDPGCDDAYEDLLPEPDQWFRHLRDKVGEVGRRLRAAFRPRKQLATRSS